MPDIVNCLWFDNEAEEAARFYTSLFPDSSLGRITRFTTEGFEHHGKPAGSVMTVEFSIADRNFLALNGGPDFRFNEAVSFVVYCDTREELDHYWETLTEGGDPSARQCGWLKDRYGVSWQVVPRILTSMLTHPDPERVRRVSAAIFEMKKLDMDVLTAAFNGES